MCPPQIAFQCVGGSTDFMFVFFKRKAAYCLVVLVDFFLNFFWDLPGLGSTQKHTQEKASLPPMCTQSILSGSDLPFSWSRWWFQVILWLISTAGSFLSCHFPLVTVPYQTAVVPWAMQLSFGLCSVRPQASGILACPLSCSTATEQENEGSPGPAETQGLFPHFPKLPETDAVLENSWVLRISGFQQKAIWSEHDHPAVLRTQLAAFMDAHISFRARNQRCFCLHV